MREGVPAGRKESAAVAGGWGRFHRSAQLALRNASPPAFTTQRHINNFSNNLVAGRSCITLTGHEKARGRDSSRKEGISCGCRGLGADAPLSTAGPKECQPACSKQAALHELFNKLKFIQRQAGVPAGRKKFAAVAGGWGQAPSLGAAGPGKCQPACTSQAAPINLAFSLQPHNFSKSAVRGDRFPKQPSGMRILCMHALSSEGTQDTFVRGEPRGCVLRFSCDGMISTAKLWVKILFSRPGCCGWHCCHSQPMHECS